ncbi:transposase, partial [Megasphaera stantonii]
MYVYRDFFTGSKFSMNVRKVIYTTNAIESLNSTYRKLNRQRSVFPSDTA